MSDPISEHRAWLQKIIAETGLSGTALAKKAGVAQTTVTRLLNLREPVHALNSRSLQAIEKASKIPFRGPAPSDAPTEDAELYDLTSGANAGLVASAMRGMNAVDPWVLKSTALNTANIIPGDILLVDLNGTARQNDIVCAQVYDWPSGTAKTLFRLYEPPFLIAQTTNDRLRRPLLVDNDKIVIKGVVVATIRLRPIDQAA